MTHALIGTRKGLFTVSVTDGVAQLGAPQFPGAPATNAMVDPRDGAAYVSINHGHFGVHLHRSDDGGTNWVEIGVPEYPPKPAGVEHINPYTQKPVEWATQLGWVIEPGHAQEPGVLWCGTIPGGLFKSLDRGDSWQLMESHWNEPARAKWAGGGFDEAGTHSVCVDPRAPGHVIIGMSCGGAWCTADGGDTWERATAGMRANFLPPELADDPDIQDPHRIVRCLDAPDVLWTQHHGGIFRSVDNGGKWVEIPQAGPSTFGFAVAAHPHDPLTAWFVPALSDEVRIPVDGALVVTRTRDGGQSFDVLSSGLPQEHAYDLVYRHCLDVDDSGEQLLMGSTTGSLWYSADSGDHWQTVSNNLPPIASVRWSPANSQLG
jgi:hypothetical protein